MTWRTTAGLLGALIAGATTNAGAQEAPHGWAFGAAGFGVYWPNDDFSFDGFGGPALQASLLVPRGVGFDVRAGYFLPTGFYDANGISGILGLTYGVPTGAHLFQVKAGGAGFIGGDSDGSGIGGGGPYAGAGMTFRVSGRFGIQLEALGRVYKSSGGWTLAPSGAVGLMLLPR